jgi:hypothetical protein
MNEQEMREVFREMREEPVPADSLARVRGRVDQRVGRRSWWKFALPLVAAGCMVAGFLLLTRPAKEPVGIAEPAPLEIARVQPPPEIPVRAAPKPRRVRPRPVEAVPSMLIRIETPDPDVVILLVN